MRGGLIVCSQPTQHHIVLETIRQCCQLVQHQGVLLVLLLLLSMLRSVASRGWCVSWCRRSTTRLAEILVRCWCCCWWWGGVPEQRIRAAAAARSYLYLAI